MDVLKIAGIILVSTILISSLPTFDKTISSLVSLSASIIILTYIIKSAEDVVYKVNNILSSNVAQDFSIIYKAVGIGLITQFVSDIAADSGNKSLANQMVFVGKAATVVLAIPVFTEILEIIGNIIK